MLLYPKQVGVGQHRSNYAISSLGRAIDFKSMGSWFESSIARIYEMRSYLTSITRFINCLHTTEIRSDSLSPSKSNPTNRPQMGSTQYCIYLIIILVVVLVRNQRQLLQDNHARIQQTSCSA